MPICKYGARRERESFRTQYLIMSSNIAYCFITLISKCIYNCNVKNTMTLFPLYLNYYNY